ncbi:MAG: hypothetical protein ACLP0B_17080 [Steroidobacteraceae bacterium]
MQAWDGYGIRVVGWKDTPETKPTGGSINAKELGLQWLTMKVAINALVTDPGLRVRLYDRHDNPKGFLRLEDTRSDKSRPALTDNDADDEKWKIGYGTGGDGNVYVLVRDAETPRLTDAGIREMVDNDARHAGYESTEKMSMEDMREWARTAVHPTVPGYVAARVHSSVAAQEISAWVTMKRWANDPAHAWHTDPAAVAWREADYPTSGELWDAIVNIDPDSDRLFVGGTYLEKREHDKPTFPTGLPCFELAPSVCCLDSVEERNEDLEGLKEFDFLFLPFPEIAIRIQIQDLLPDLYEIGPGFEDLEAAFLTFTASGELSLVTAADAGVETNSPMLFTKATLGDVCVFSHNGKETSWRLSEMSGVSLRGKSPPGFSAEQAKAEFIVLMWDAITTLVRATNTMHGVTITERNTRFHNKHKQSKPQFAGPLGSIYISMTRLAAPDPTTLPDYVPGTHASPKAHKRRAHIHTVSFGIGHREKRKERFPMMWINRVEGEADPPARKYTVH